jgi:hypothetical protein
MAAHSTRGLLAVQRRAVVPAGLGVAAGAGAGGSGTERADWL